MLSLSYEKGIVESIISYNQDISWIKVKVKDNLSRAVNYNKLTGQVKPGDQVILNTTAVELSLGTGGQHFVIFNESNPSMELEGHGHIMKLRYTPLQVKCLVVEEEDSPYHDQIKNFQSLDGHLVIVGSLHSMLAPIAAHLKFKRPDLRLNYIMTDDAALAANFSNTIYNLKDLKIIDNVITTGNAFGGDYEATNFHTGLIFSKEVLKSDISLVMMGPGIVGTATKYGFTGVSQANQIDIVNRLGGRPIAVPRISFADKRERHFGISHHSLTALAELCYSRADLVLANYEADKLKIIEKQIREYSLDEKHKITFINGSDIRDSLNSYGLNIRTMGRGIDEDYEFFETLAAVANYTEKLINKQGVL